MGGIGSGGYEHQRTKGTVTNDRALDIRFWQREGVMKLGLRFEVRWGQQDTLGDFLSGLSLFVIPASAGIQSLILL